MRLSIAALLIAALVIGTDFTGALLLVPPIENAFSADITTSQWVLNLYALTFSMVLVTGGRLGDMYGRRRVLLVGTAIFIAGSLGCLLAPSIGWLIRARGLQGVGSGLMWPSILGYGATLLGKDKRAMLMGATLGAVTSGNVVGPLISGVVVSIGDWRLFFVVSVVGASLVLLLNLRFLPHEPAAQVTERVDFPGMLVLGAAVLGLTYGLDVGADWGWGSTRLLGLFALSVILFGVFPLIERRVRDPMVPPALMRNREFVLTLLTNGLLVPSIFIAFLYFPQFLQKALGWSVLGSSLGVLPLMVLLAVGSLVSGRLYEQVGPRRLLLVGYSLVTLGAASVVVLEPSWGYFAILPAMVLIGFGGSVTTGTAGTAAVSAVSPSRAGLASGLTFTLHLSFGALGVAAATAIMNASSLSSLTNGLARSGITMSAANVRVLNAAAPHGEAARGVLAGYDPATIEKIRATVIDAFAAGMSRAYWLALVSAMIGIVVVLAIHAKKLESTAENPDAHG